jgi:hypothetical protein
VPKELFSVAAEINKSEGREKLSLTQGTTHEQHTNNIGPKPIPFTLDMDSCTGNPKSPWNSLSNKNKMENPKSYLDSLIMYRKSFLGK